MVVDSRIPRPKRYLNADALIANLKARFGDVPDNRRQASCDYSMTDTLTAALAMFLLKEPSLLSFEERSDEESIDQLFGIRHVPSDSQMREILDGIEIEPLNEAFADLFHELQLCFKRFLRNSRHVASFGITCEAMFVISDSTVSGTYGQRC